jgi:hypothetical protein
MNIADIQSSVTLYLETGKFEAEAAKEGEKAGAAMGAQMSSKVQTSLSKVAGAGIGLEIGKQMLHGLESAISAIANVIPDMLGKSQAFATNVEEMTKKTGASAEVASRFAGTLTYLGQSTEGLGMMLKTLSVQVVSNEGQFTKLGIATRDSGGNLLDIITILSNLRSYLSTAGDGATKMALATHLLGKSAGNLVEYLNLTNEQASFLNRMLDNLGVTMGSDATAAAEGLAREENLLGLAWQGLSNTLAQAVVPALRQVIGGIIEFVSKHGPELRQTLADITNSVLGFATSLLGVENVTPFQMQMDALGGSSKNVTLSFDQWAQQMGYTVPVIAKTVAKVKDGTAAIDAQVKSIGKQETALSALGKQQDRTYQRGLDALNAQLDAQGKLLDTQDQAAQRHQRDADLQRGLRDAEEALAATQLSAQEAQAKAASDPSLSAQAKAQAAIDAARQIRGAEEALSQARQAIADETRTRGEEDRRSQIDGVKSYLADIDKLVQDADNRKANLATLGGMEKGLKAAGPAAPGSDAAIQLTAVLAAEKRIRDAMANEQKTSALAILKTQLQEQAQAMSAATAATGSAKVTADKKTLATLQAQYKTYLAEQTIATNKTVVAFAAIFKGDPKTGTGLGGAMSKAFSDAQKAGEAFHQFLDGPFTASLRTIADLLGGIGRMLAADAAVLKWIEHPDITLRGALGPDIADWYDSFVNNPGAPRRTDNVTTPGFATGGYIPPLTWGMTGERGPEPVFGGRTGVTVVPNGQPAVIRIEIGGRPLVDYVDEQLSYRRRR